MKGKDFQMRKLPQFLLRCSVFAFAPLAANAAGTYYTGNYQSPQTNYSQTQTYAQRQAAYTRSAGYNTNGYSAYSSTRPNTMTTRTQTAAQPQAQQRKTTSSASGTSRAGQNGFWLDGGISHEFAQWQFEMKESNSILHYDNLEWNVFDLRGGYVFDVGNTKMQVDAGFKYGIQSGETKMVDDDITNGGYFITQWVDGNNNNAVIGEQIGHALSIGTSDGGSMLGFNVGVGLPDFFKLGNVRFTPSIGYRYFKYELETKKNYGLSVDTAACFKVDGSDEVQCDPAIIINYTDGKQQIIWRDENGKIEIANGVSSIDTQGTYYYQQPGTSHSYEVEWSGPYIAMDMDYLINQNNAVNARVELGFPGYTSTGDQPYRFDWAHPKSVEDKADMFSAFHLGMGANWSTAITDTISLSVGVTYDYYTVGDADAKTYLNGNYYTTWYNTILNSDQWKGDETAMLNPETGDATAINIKNLEADCPGWVCSSDGEIESFYKSLGVRVGINAKF